MADRTDLAGPTPSEHLPHDASAMTPAPMVGWYDPRQLTRTAMDVVVSTLIGRHADQRLLEALGARVTNKIYDYATSDPEAGQAAWVDYVADAGDGWDSTYAVAYALAQPTLTVSSPGAGEQVTERGRLLIFGGDEVYPTPDRGAYKRRLTQAYEAALPRTEAPHPHLFAIPGNHDWYDSLVSFTRMFCSERWLGGWLTQQSRSYFALRLPHGWWLLGTDVQLGSDIDRPQVEYFETVASQMAPTDRVILCNAEPHWVYAGIYGTLDGDYNENNLAFLEERVLKRQVSVYLAGDLHHYRRHEAPDGTHKITVGGGGAFLHPTHGPSVATLPERDQRGTTRRVFTCKSSFPDPRTSRRLTWRNLLFPVLNPWFGLVPAVLYVISAWVVMADIGQLGLRDLPLALHTTIHDVVNNPGGVFWTLLVFCGFLLFTDTHSRRYRLIAGPIHGLAHVAATFFLGWGTSYLAVSVLRLPFRSITELLVAAVVLFVGGALVGSWIMGVYLFISLNVFGRHSNEAFSSLRIPDWKSFLRLKIERDGTLTIFPIGIRRVPRKWARSPEETGSRFRSADPRATRPELIEPPILVTRSRTMPAAPSGGPTSARTGTARR